MKRFFSLYSILFSFLWSLVLITTAYSQDETSEGDALMDLIYDYSDKGYYSYYKSNFDSAEYYVLKALNLQYSNASYEIDVNVAINHVTLASIYRILYDNKKALEHLNKAEEIMNNEDPTDILFATIYHNKGNIFKSRNDLYRTKEYYEYALDFARRNEYQDEEDFAFVFSNYINLLFELEEFELAEQKLSSIDLNSLNASSFLEFRIHITNAISYAELEKIDLAEYHFRKAKEIIDSQEGDYSYSSEKTRYFYNIIDFYILYEKYDLALAECDRAFLFIESLDPKSVKSKTIYNSDILYRAASIHYRQGDIDRALMLANRGIDNLTTFLNRLSIVDTHYSTRNEYTSYLPELYILKSQILLQKFNRSSSTENLIAAFDSYQKAIETLNYIKLAMRDENSKLFATSQILEVYYEAIYVSKLLFDLTGDGHYLEKSFEFAESSKSFALYSEIKELEAMEFGDVPHEVRERENRFAGEIQRYEEELYEEQVADEPDSNQIEFFKDKLFHLKEDYDELKQEIEQNNSKYYELKYNPVFITLEEVRKQIPYRDAMIEYVLSDTLLITYVIDRKGIHSFSQEIGPEFADECFEYYELLYSQNFSSGVHENYRRFVRLGRKFYNILIEPCLQYTDRKNFTIVPDGAITYIPFEGLITENTDTEYINYLTLPYMIKDYSVGYSHSSTLMFSERLKTKSPEKEVLAFAPVYKEIDYNYSDPISIRQALDETDFLLPLLGIIKEVQSIKETVPSRVFINERATEANFKKHASDYNILHLAMHTIMRDDNPLYSMLAFTNVESSDSIEDNKLYAYEIYNMKLNAQMAVLSSCNSGFGKLLKGEGMMSLARGFMYAGCPSIVMTLWQVADKSSSELMTSFYRYLKKGKSKQEAMRLAKLDYLEAADELTSNPYFWSAFVVLGDGTPIYRKTGIAYWMIIITLFLGIVIFIQYRRS